MKKQSIIMTIAVIASVLFAIVLIFGIWKLYIQPPSDEDYRNVSGKVDQLSEVYITMRNNSFSSVTTAQQAEAYRKQLMDADADTRKLFVLILNTKPVYHNETVSEAFEATKKSYETLWGDLAARREAAETLVQAASSIRAIGIEGQSTTAAQAKELLERTKEPTYEINKTFRTTALKRLAALAKLEEKITEGRKNGALNDADTQEYTSQLKTLKIVVSEWGAQIQQDPESATAYVDALAALRSQVGSR